jgi:hypothetical protein
VFIHFLKWFKDCGEYDFDEIFDNQTELSTQKHEIILKWSAFKYKIEQQPDLATRYKTFDGKIYKKVEHLTDDTDFIHINISATTSVLRIATIMHKFNIPENAVKITLK